MGRKHKRTQQFTKPKLATSSLVQSKTIHLAVSPEQLIKNGDIPKAIDALQKQLTTEPTDECRRLLGSCYFQIHNYKEAANTWLTIKAPMADDLSDAGLALLCEGECEQARSTLQSSLELEERAYTLYLQALAIQGDQKYYQLHGEEHTNLINLLQKAQGLPNCPVDAFLLLDDLLSHHDPILDRTTIFEKGVLLYPDHIELRLRYARHLAYKTNDYSKSLVVVAPLLLQEEPPQRALSCAVLSAFELGVFEDALMYADQLRPTSYRLHGPGIDQVKGDIYLAWGKTEEALACYEREVQRDDFEAAALGFFKIAKVWLVCNEREKALRAALKGAAFWLDYPNDIDGGSLLFYCEVFAGEGDDQTDAGLYFSGDIIKEVCETILSSGQETAIDEKGRLAYLLYKIRVLVAEATGDDQPEIDALLLMVEQGTLHPHMGEMLVTYYIEEGDIIRAIQVHLDYCLWKFSALEKHRPQPTVDDEDLQISAIDWTFSTYDARLSCDQELLHALSETDRGRCHTIAWDALQSHVAKTDIVTKIFVPLFNSLWGDVLIAGSMHREVVETARLLIEAAADNKRLWWLLAYHLHELKQNDEAESVYRRYLQLVPNSASAMHNLSAILEEKGTFPEALALSQKAAALSPGDELITRNATRLARIDAEQEQAQRKQEGAVLWSRLADSQKWLLCLLELYPSSHWSALLPRIKQDERQLRQLQEDWEWLHAQQIVAQSESEEPVRIVSLLEPYVREEGFRYWLATELARVQIRKKKNLWLPAAAELGDEQLIGLDAQQRDLMQQAFMRQVAQVSLSGLEQVYLHFYRRIWKRLLIEWKMYSELADNCEIFLTRLSVMTRQEMWECAYYATFCSDLAHQRQAEKWYKAYLEQGENQAAYHNLSFIYFKRKQCQAALQMIEQALRLAPEDEGELKLKAQIQQALQEEEEQKRQQELERLRQQELREQQLKSVESTIVAHLGDVDFYKQKILRTLKGFSYFSNKKTFARDVRMEDYQLAGHWKKLVAWGMIIENGRQPTVHPLIATYLEQGWPAVTGSFTDTITQPTHEKQTAPSNTTSSASQERKISAITRRDIMDKLCSWKVEGRLDLIEFLEMTWPNLDSMPSPNSGPSLKYEISLMCKSPDWDGNYHFLFYNWFQLGNCDDELFTSFLASCIHPLIRTDKKEVAELLSFFNEALYPDGYVLRPASTQSGRPIYKAFALGANDEEYIVSHAVEIIEQLARKFHLVAKKLGQRYDHRTPFKIQDEYDVQDLFHALLTPFFEDIRPEEVAPSHAGGYGRIDFLIKAEQIVIEIKKTRPSLKVKELRDQLIVDKEIYRTHPHCRTFIAFVYDPDGYIDNPIGFEKDLSNVAGDMRVKVIVAPR